MIYFILVLAFAHSIILQKTQFLQADTSKQSLALGLESFEETFSSFTRNLDSSLKKIFEEIKALDGLNEEVAISVIKGDISDLEHREFEITQEIKRINNLLTDNDKCTIETNCNDCASIASCVWCESSVSCLKGDSDGPLSSACSVFHYKSCPNTSCSHYLTCYTCISSDSCTWCASSLTCQELSSSSSSSSSSCPDLSTYSKSASGKDNCPPSQSFSVETQFLPSGTYELLQDSLERLYKEYAGCEALISLLEEAAEEIEKEFQKTLLDSLDEAAVEPSLDGLADEVKRLQEEEIEAEDQAQLDYANSYAQDVLDSAQEDLEGNTESTVDVVRDGGVEVQEEVQSAGNELKIPLSSIDNSIKEINEVLGINEKK